MTRSGPRRERRARFALGVLGVVLCASVLPTACVFHLDDPVRGGASGKGGAPETGGSGAGGATGEGGMTTGGLGAGAATGGSGAGGAPDCGISAKPCDGKCVQIDDPAYGCGAQGCNRCPDMPGTTFGCSNGACTIASCQQGHGDCNGQDSDGCEINFDDLPPRASPPAATVDAHHAPGDLFKIDGLGIEQDWIATQRTPIGDPCLKCTTVEDSSLPMVTNTSAPPVDDLSAWFRAAWSDAWLYALVEVRDDDLVSKPTGQAGMLGTAALEDDVELLVSSDRSVGGFGMDDMQLFFALDGLNMSRAYQPTPMRPENVDFAVAKGHGCYTIEIKVSFNYVSSSFTPKPEEVIGFTAAVNDWDNKLRADGGMVPTRQSHLFSKNPGDGYWFAADSFAGLRLAP